MKSIQAGNIKDAKNREGRQSVLINNKMQWFNEFSDIGSEILSQSNLTMAKAQSIHCEHSSQDIPAAGETDTQQNNASPSQYHSEFQEKEHIFENIDKLSFDIW